MSQQVVNFDLSVLRPHPRNDEFFSDVEGEEFSRLKQSIQELGILTPLRVAKDMTIISGHQRYRAAKELGLEDVPVIIDDTLKDDDDKLIQLIASNFGRMKNDPVKQGKWIKEYEQLRGVRQGSAYKKAGQNNSVQVTQDDIAKELGVHPTTLQNLKKLNTLLPEFQDIISEGRVTATTGYKVISRLSKEEQSELLKKIEALPENQRLTQPQVQSYIDQIRGLEAANAALTAEKSAAEAEVERWKKDAVEATRAVQNSDDSKRYMEMKESRDAAEEKYRMEHEELNTLKERAKRVNQEMLASNEKFNSEIRRLEHELELANRRADAAAEQVGNADPVVQTVEVEVYPDDYEELRSKARAYDQYCTEAASKTYVSSGNSANAGQRDFENCMSNYVDALIANIDYLMDAREIVYQLPEHTCNVYAEQMRQLIRFANIMLSTLNTNKEVA